ncbi:MAG: 3,4-dihydroxy-2-butanone-4-phosphate synthase [Phycisphaeraceae bacterium]|nr:3,4-dihydroxy-2-butanone-4-phosphate synthase [Phycisphaeraceae bacterium]
MDSISDILTELREGRMIVLVDDEDRENEGDLVCAAEHATPAMVNFMLREARGMMCVALSARRCEELELVPQSTTHTAPRGTAYTVSVDASAKFGVSTGVSAADRSTTIRRLVDPQASPHDFTRPGHTHPLRAREGGTLVRAGQTEGSIDLCRLAGLRPGAVIIEVMNEDGTMARRPELETICRKHHLKMCSVRDIIQHRLQREKLVQRIETVPFESEYGRFRLIAYHCLVDALPHVALVKGNVGQLDDRGEPVEVSEPVLVRMHSQNLLGDVLGDMAQPSGRTLHAALRKIDETGQGALVYLRHEMTGRGLLQRLQTLNLPHQDREEGGHLPRLGLGQPTPGMQPPPDKGAYGIGCQILRDLGIRRLKLLTNHAFMPSELIAYGLEIEEFVRVEG